jgi:hypothetical protein
MCQKLFNVLLPKLKIQNYANNTITRIKESEFKKVKNHFLNTLKFLNNKNNFVRFEFLPKLLKIFNRYLAKQITTYIITNKT